MTKPEFIADILIVDDLAENLLVLSRMLTKKNYKVRKAINGKLALGACQSKPPDLILLDIKMPELDGYEVCKILKSNPKTKEIPVIFLSALNEVFDKVKAFKIGAVDYITKPFELEEVNARIEHQLTIRKQKLLLQAEIEQRKQNQLQLQQEIKKRQETEEILFQSRALLDSVLNISSDGVAALQAVRNELNGKIEDFRFLLVNPMFAGIFNTSKYQLRGELMNKKNLDKFNNNLFKKLVMLVNKGGILEDEIQYTNGDKTSWYFYTANKLGDGFAITIRDITERKNLELHLESLIKIDSLTKIANRRLFDQTLQEEWQKHQRLQQPLSLILIDIDYFKLYNDCYGHLKGDQCLYQVAQAMNKCVKRAGELVARYGGEEFAVILPHTDQDHACQVAQLILNRIHTVQIPHEQSKIKPYVTLSLGIATMIPPLQSSVTNLINIADQALYQAKESGRDRLICGKFN